MLVLALGSLGLTFTQQGRSDYRSAGNKIRIGYWEQTGLTDRAIDCLLAPFIDEWAGIPSLLIPRLVSAIAPPRITK